MASGLVELDPAKPVLAAVVATDGLGLLDDRAGVAQRIQVDR